MTSQQIRQSFLDFFKSKQHTIVPSSSLLPDSPNLKFTNAGMNQFVPIFLGQKPADVSRWAGVVPGRDTRAADTQRRHRAGGQHNDHDDGGWNLSPQREALGNWVWRYSNAEAIDWSLGTHRVWHFPKNRLYATVYKPRSGDPSEFDQRRTTFGRNSAPPGSTPPSTLFLGKQLLMDGGTGRSWSHPRRSIRLQAPKAR
jgi:alanyl-tRNA synthetase